MALRTFRAAPDAQAPSALCHCIKGTLGPPLCAASAPRRRLVVCNTLPESLGALPPARWRGARAGAGGIKLAVDLSECSGRGVKEARPRVSAAPSFLVVAKDGSTAAAAPDSRTDEYPVRLSAAHISNIWPVMQRSKDPQPVQLLSMGRAMRTHPGESRSFIDAQCTSPSPRIQMLLLPWTLSETEHSAAGRSSPPRCASSRWLAAAPGCGARCTSGSWCCPC